MAKSPLIHVASLVFNTPLAIFPEKLEVILRAVGPRLGLDEAALCDLIDSGALQSGAHPADHAARIQAQMDDDDDAAAKPYKLTPEGVAVIPIRGTLMKRYSWLAAYSGLSTYEGVRRASTAALEDPQVKALLLDVDSPGGTTHGCFELADSLFQMRRSGDKPMWACANDLAASAAYALASAADRVYVTRTGGVGSIGVFALHVDQSASDEAAGLKFTYLYAGGKKIDGNPHEPLSKGARKDIQAEVDREYEMFVACVARNRGATPAQIRDTEAIVKYGDQALGLLADEVATCEEVLAELTRKVTKPQLNFNPGASAETPAKEESMPKEAEEKKAEKDDTKAVLAAEPKDDEEEEEEEQDDKQAGDDKKTKKAAKDEDDAEGKCGNVTELPVAAEARAQMIAELCEIAGMEQLTGKYILKGYSVAQVRKFLRDRRAKMSAENSVRSFVSGDTGVGRARSTVDQAIQQARTMAANSGGQLSQSQAMERILRANPEIYEGYNAERDEAIARSPSGRGPVLTEFVLNSQRRYLQNLGLSTAMEDVPVRRSM